MAFPPVTLSSAPLCCVLLTKGFTEQSFELANTFAVTANILRGASQSDDCFRSASSSAQSFVRVFRLENSAFIARCLTFCWRIILVEFTQVEFVLHVLCNVGYVAFVHRSQLLTSASQSKPIAVFCFASSLLGLWNLSCSRISASNDVFPTYKNYLEQAHFALLSRRAPN